MALPNDNRVIIAIGAGLVIIAAVVLALIFTGGGDKTPEAPPAARGGLTVDLADAPTLEPTRELRCFVDGQFVGMATLAHRRLRPAAGAAAGRDGRGRSEPTF
ncbi:MAG: hypothetical protein ACK4MY_16565 [Brevundimonas sp.]